jgi:rare lipoprotein A
VLCAVFLAILLFLGGCSTHVKYTPGSELASYSETGKASFYSMKFQFRKTASGERFNNYSMTAAHKTLPFGTRVIVTNLNNDKTVKVRINDRGPFVKGRIIDLTRAAFAKIDELEKGLTEVEIRVIN